MHWEEVFITNNNNNIGWQFIIIIDLNGLVFGTWWSSKYENEQSDTLKGIWNTSSISLPLDYRAACAYEVLLTSIFFFL